MLPLIGFLVAVLLFLRMSRGRLRQSAGWNLTLGRILWITCGLERINGEERRVRLLLTLETKLLFCASTHWSIKLRNGEDSVISL